MKTIEETKKWLLKNRVDEDGDLNLRYLDFSDFDGDVYISNMKVKGNLMQMFQEIEGSLCQGGQKIKGTLDQSCQKVQGNLYQSCQKVQGNFFAQKLKEDEEYEERDYYTTIAKKKIRYTHEELVEKLGHDFEIVEDE